MANGILLGDGECVATHIAGSDVEIGTFDGQGDGDSPRACTGLEDSCSKRNVQRALDKQLGLRARNEDAVVDRHVQAAERCTASNIRQWASVGARRYGVHQLVHRVGRQGSRRDGSGIFIQHVS